MLAFNRLATSSAKKVAIVERRVLILAPIATPGGAERALLNLVTRLPARGWRPDVVFLNGGDVVSWFFEADVPVTVLDAGRFRQAHLATAAILRLAKMARQADVVLGSMNKGQLYAGPAAVIAGRRSVWWQHGIPAGGRMERLAARTRPYTVVAGSPAAVNAQAALTPNVRVHCIPPGTPIECVRQRGSEAGALRAQMGWQGKQIVGIIGRLHEEKGQRLFIEAAARLAKQWPTARFLVVGGAILGWEGEYEQDLREQVVQLGLEDRFHFTGHVDDPERWMASTDVLVVASRHESFCLVVVEGMALGKPVVATRCGGPEFIINEGVDGFLVEIGDAGAIAEAVERLLRSPQLRGSISTAAAARSLDFDADITADRFAAVLADASSLQR